MVGGGDGGHRPAFYYGNQLGDDYMSDTMLAILALSVTFNLYLIHRVLGMAAALFKINDLLRDVAANKVRVIKKPDGDWGMEKVE